MSTSQMTVERLALVGLLALVTISAAAANEAQAERIKVLLIRNSDKQHAIEEASSLSLELPRQASASQRDDDQQRAANGNPTSLGYQQVSLASLTLHQHRPRSADNATKPANGHQWNELNLVRHRPSWLNVSSQFKITGSSIEELQFMMPAEYMLRQAFDSPILLKTKLGIVEGVRSIRFNKHLYTFLGIPYARPPIDELRFQAPRPVERWEGVLQATKWPPFCVQPSMTLASKSSPVHVLSQIMSEDCLYLNIWSPSLKFNQLRRRPVMVWIHGGAFQYGGISVDENDGSALALAGDVVVVTLNYRVSAFGFLNANNREQAPNNVGLLDQRLALEWVQANIKQFGGDPHQVTLFGESAGGHSVGLHMISPGSQALFKRAILQSGVPISFLRSYDVNSDNKGSVIAEGVGSIMLAKRLKCLDDAAPADGHNTSTTSATSSPATGATSDNDNESESNEEQQSGAPTSTNSQPVLNDATLACMRQRSSLEILKAMGAPGNAGFFPTGNDAAGFFPHGPVMESFEPDTLRVGPQKEYLLGINSDEGTFMLHYGMPALFPARDVPKVSSIETLKAALQAEIERMAKAAAQESANKSELRSASDTPNGSAQAHLYRPLLRTSTSVLENFMPKSSVRVLENGTVVGNSSAWNREAEFGRNVASLITDIIFLCPARSLARTLAESGRNVYFYVYSHRSSMSQYHQWMGVTHHDEVEFVFGRPLRMADVYSGRDIEMSRRLMGAWAHFAYTGQMPDQLGVKWPKYDQEEHNYMSLVADSAATGQRYHDRVCNIYDTVISVHLQDT